MEIEEMLDLSVDDFILRINQLTDGDYQRREYLYVHGAFLSMVRSKSLVDLARLTKDPWNSVDPKFLHPDDHQMLARRMLEDILRMHPAMQPTKAKFAFKRHGKYLSPELRDVLIAIGNNV